MENLVPILIGLIWLAYKYYQSSQKKQQEAKRRAAASVSDSYSESADKASVADDEFEKYVEQFFGISSTPKTSTTSFVTEPVDQYTNEGEAPDMDVSYESIEYQEKLRPRETKITQPSAGNNVENDTHPLIEDFDLKKAVIYSEIMRLKYF